MKRVGIVGAGGIGRWHAERWRKLPVELVGFYDIVPTAAQSMAQDFGARAYDSLGSLLANVDIVDICCQTDAHKEGVLAAAAAGVAIVCEKPLARHVEDCEEMIAACEAGGVPLFVAQVVRFFPQFAQAKNVLDAGSIGKPGFYRSVRAGSPPYSGSRKWFMDFEKSGGVIMDVGIHDIDFARWCMGEVERVFTRGLTFDNDSDVDHALLSLRCRSGAIGHIECSWAHPKGQFVTRVEIAGQAGLLEWDSRVGSPLKSAVLQEGHVTRTSSSPLAEEDDPYYRELAHFLECLENDTPFLVTPHDGLMAVKVSLAAIESMRRGQPVTIADEVTL